MSDDMCRYQKICYGAYMMFEEAKYQWDNARQRFQANGKMITWVVFNESFLEKYFSADVWGRKEVEFFEPKQENMIVADYATKFEELSRFLPYYNGAEAEISKCNKFQNGLCLEIKQFIGYQEIHQFSVLVNTCRIDDEDNHVRFSHYKSVSDKRNGNLNYGKSYGAPYVKGKQMTFDEKTPGGIGALNSVKCYKCGEFGHHISECKSTTANYIKYGKP